MICLVVLKLVKTWCSVHQATMEIRLVRNKGWFMILMNFAFLKTLNMNASIRVLDKYFVIDING